MAGCFYGTLQWGHAFSGVETTLTLEFPRYDAVLQWGHAFSGVETPPVGRRERPRIDASMGPRLFRRGNS